MGSEGLDSLGLKREGMMGLSLGPVFCVRLLTFLSISFTTQLEFIS